jgi:hypothetical protein
MYGLIQKKTANSLLLSGKTPKTIDFDGVTYKGYGKFSRNFMTPAGFEQF